MVHRSHRNIAQIVSRNVVRITSRNTVHRAHRNIAQAVSRKYQKGNQGRAKRSKIV